MDKVPGSVIDQIAAALATGRRTALFMGGRALREDSLWAAGQIAKACGADLL